MMLERRKPDSERHYSNCAMHAVPMQGVRRPQRAQLMPRATIDTSAGVDAKKANLLKAIELSPITVRYNVTPHCPPFPREYGEWIARR